VTRDPDVRRFLFALAFFACCLGLIAVLFVVGLWH